MHPKSAFAMTRNLAKAVHQRSRAGVSLANGKFDLIRAPKVGIVRACHS